MFDSLTDKFSGLFRKLSGRGKITEANVREAMAEVRTALLEADVNYGVVEQFTQRVQEKALGTEVLGSGALDANGVWRGSLYLRGGGDPTFGTKSFVGRSYGAGASVERLAALLEDAGIERVSGRVTYSQEILTEFGWLEKGRGIGIDIPGSGYSRI